jgi:sugar phosphate isomerase/epimerase
VLGDFYLCASAIDGVSFDERLDAAAAAGYMGIGLRPGHYAAELAKGLSTAALQSMLSERALELVEIGFLADWWESGERAARSRLHEDRLYRLNDSLGGRHIVLISGPRVDRAEAVAERFAAVCDRAQEHGLRVGLEFLPWTDTRDAFQAWRIAQLADRRNGGIVLDSWHHFRGSADDELIRTIPAHRIVAVQLSDGERQPVGTHLEDSFRRRRLPGHGDFDLRSFIRVLDGMGVTAPVGVEVLSDELRELPPSQAARQMAAASRALLASARGVD